ncbi:MAG: hypothetical protein JSV91_12335 [Phycisphaerales bacterium]|nr:MAG: hypothetical protein JSV91_12335 [Phycisphaerales bacterium]
MLRKKIFLAAVVALCACSSAPAETVTVYYTLDAGGWNPNPLNGMTAKATWTLEGEILSILLENDSTGIPDGAMVADSLLVSLGFNLLDDVLITSGDTAVIGEGSYGLGIWSDRGPGDSVAEEWLWTNEYGGDLMLPYAQVISTSMGQDEGMSYLFGGGEPFVNGPFGGIAADPPLTEWPDDQPGVADSILFTLTLSGGLQPGQLQYIADNSIVEYGSDFQYLIVPAPATLSVLLLSLGMRRRRR